MPAPTLDEALLPFQREGVAAAIERWDGRILLGDEMGLGKTLQVSTSLCSPSVPLKREGGNVCAGPCACARHRMQACI